MWRVADKPLPSFSFVGRMKFWICSAMLVIVTCLVNLGYLTYNQTLKIHRREALLQQYVPDDFSVEPSVQELLYLNGWEYLGDRHPDFFYSF